MWLLAATTQLAFAETENPALRGDQVQLPNDVDLKASYCLAVLKLQYSALMQFVPFELDAKSASDPDTRKLLEEAKKSLEEVEVLRKKEIARLDDNINRIQLFILPRISYLEPTAILAAYSRGETDFRRQSESSKPKQCSDRCMSTIEADRDQGASCLQGCMEESELSRRIFQCRDLSFLPY